ncbi:MAG TPA: hypothetical protein VF503_09085 [Sphingobium sp.]|uniref:hypothetical protein n=1 Tax=Sphingobium sp. TaxID=1912891 RepID=UPI002ED45732
MRTPIGARKRAPARPAASYRLLIRDDNGMVWVDVRPDHPDGRTLNQRFDTPEAARSYARTLAHRRGWEIEDRAFQAATEARLA